MAERLALDRERELCPWCGTRPIRVVSSGTCQPCHVRRLAETHAEALAEIDARRALWTERQRLKRARDLEDVETAGAGYGVI